MKRTAVITAAAAVVAAGAAVAVPAAAALAATAGPAVHAPASSAALRAIAITMTGKKISVGSGAKSGGVRIVSTVTGEAQGEPTLVRLNPGVTTAQFFAALKKAAADPNNLDGVASIVVDAVANRGISSVQASLRPGNYVALDTARSNPASWPFTTFTVVRAAHPVKLPAPKATIAAIEFGFRGAGRLHDGELVRFVNRGFLVHMIVFVTAKNEAQAREIAALLRAGQQAKAGRLATGFGTFAGPLSRGGGQQFVLHGRPGYYVLACFMETQDGRDHTQLGMERVIRIVK